MRRKIKISLLAYLALLLFIAGCGDEKGNSLEVYPAQATIQPGGAVRFMAIASDARGRRMEPDPSLEWTISDNTLATVGSGRLDSDNIDFDTWERSVIVKGLAPGSVEVKFGVKFGFSATAQLVIDPLSSRPKELFQVYPREGDTILSRNCPSVGAFVNYKKCDCENDSPEWMRLFLDGVEVGFRQQPFADAENRFLTFSIGYGGCYPSPSLSPGTHEAEFHIKSMLGRTGSYKWSFTITVPGSVWCQGCL